MIFAAAVSGGCGQVSDMLGLSSKPAKAPAALEKEDAVAADSPAAATPGQAATTTAAGSKGSTTASRPARKRTTATGITTASETSAASNAASPELALVDNDSALESRAGASGTPALAPVVNGARPALRDERRIYSNEDTDVVPARLIKAQTTGPVFRNMASSINTMELIISKQGRVEEVKLTSPSRKMTDMLLLSGAKTWKFVPATKDGQPVRYRTQFSWEETP
jgi:hypothetical protein